MAKKITVVRRYRPEIKRMKTLKTSEMVADMARSTSLNEGSIRFVLYGLRNVIMRAHRTGQAVKIDGLETFTSTIRLDVLFRLDPNMLRHLNVLKKFYAKTLNKPNIGKTADELMAQWNTDQPEDHVED